MNAGALAVDDARVRCPDAVAEVGLQGDVGGADAGEFGAAESQPFVPPDLAVHQVQLEVRRDLGER